MKKTFVQVVVKFSKSGQIVPLKVLWDDGKEFEIERVFNVSKSASLKVGGMGDRYDVQILDKRTYLFYEDGKWFVEEK